ncbi:dehydratase [Allopusillimonas soli]|uniref:MaoC family dehydratase N-terminal domain-containing protein n=1 Tax=Allopusillimonas soli TaxID=659016 RepID=A0A853F6K0_9BURK|nr:MaoC/PaaZ C-terminal domain-containing protein [Allopusillimonas soli]NYT35468.1 MaoC family dehydratase N-terminal domain-containing protein [Allopusillimonas soli]TEA75881.1 dehydratase [Allopusillimonas soli]
MTTYYLEDFAPDQVFESGGRTITEADLTFFSMLSGDWNPIHANEAYARTTRFGQRVVHGVLGMAVSTGMLHELGIFHDSVIAMLGFRNWQFLAPLFVNDTIHLRLTITSVEPGKSGNSGKLGRRFELVNQHGDVVQAGESDVLVLTRQGAQARAS